MIYSRRNSPPLARFICRDPNSKEFSDLLYANSELLESLSRALGENGILISQTGEADGFIDRFKYNHEDEQFKRFLEGLEEVGFENVAQYDEAQALPDAAACG